MCFLSKYIKPFSHGHRSSGTTAYGGTGRPSEIMRSIKIEDFISQGRRDFEVDDILWGSVGVVSVAILVTVTINK